MYKILHLVTGEDIKISNGFIESFITDKMIPFQSKFGLCSPGYIGEYVGDNKYHLAIFTTQTAAKMWLEDLLGRRSIKDFNFRMEHFEIMEI